MAHRRGFVLDEVGRCGDDAISELLGLLDGHPIDTPAGLITVRHPIAATSNQSPEELEPALASRFVWVACYDAAPGIVQSLPSEWRKLARKSMTHDAPAMPSRSKDPRAWLAAHAIYKLTGDLPTAARIAGLTDVAEQLLVEVA